MRSKLAFKNAMRSIKDYAIYFITLAFGVCIFYMFNSIYSQQAMLGLTDKMTNSTEALQKVLSYVSIFVAVVLGFLIVYANNFFIKRRKKEMGIYLTLGMEKRDVSAILLLETAIIAVFALVIGAVLGIFLSQFMSVFTARMFKADLTKLSFVFSASALLKCILFFLLIFCVVIVFNVSAIGKYKLIDLIYENRKNEVLKAPNKKYMVLIFVVSVAMLAVAYYLIVTNGMMEIGFTFFFSILLGGIGTLLFFYSLSGLFTSILQTNKKVYFSGLNMFVVRQLGNKINTNFVSISVVSIILLFTIGIFATGYGMQDVMSKELEGYAGYDFSFIRFYEDGTEKDSPFVNLQSYLKEKGEVESYGSFILYKTDLTYGDFEIELASDISLWKHDLVNFVALSEYNEAMAMQGIDAIELEEDKYVIVTNFNSMNEFAKMVLEKGVLLELDRTALYPKDAVVGSIKNGMNQAVIVVGDQYISNLTPQEAVCNVNCIDKGAVTQFETMVVNENTDDIKLHQYYYISRARLMVDAVGNKALLSYLSIYLGIVFMITCVAVLAIQQLTEVEDNRLRFNLLQKLGSDQRMINKALFLQILCYFLAPLLLAVIHSYFGLKAVVETLNIYGKIDIARSGTVTAVFVIVLYVIYFIITYTGCKNVLRNK